jgi:hypothetical protein
MDIQELTKEATRRQQLNIRTYLSFEKGVKPPKGFPRGELMTINPTTGIRTYLFDSTKILKWCSKKNKLKSIKPTSKTTC